MTKWELRVYITTEHGNMFLYGFELVLLFEHDFYSYSYIIIMTFIVSLMNRKLLY